VGGKTKNMHGDRRARLHKAEETCLHGDTRLIGKTAVMGIMDRQSRKVRATVISRINRETLQSEILNHVAPESKIYTNERKAWEETLRFFSASRVACISE